ncbi:MFS transporter [Acidiferrimicrobium sp. IK]|uniref:MFS transporter n=1 Tax=Acidiferrimicrobium sp. IK TaxID=2871700 RepID=UPI0021CB8DD3|nr:MFS transporter [Acidiferrimicrobium sp. IK]MCU4183790.1 MFS transporter [Acidiferrimicrobium sp. IK]
MTAAPSTTSPTVDHRLGLRANWWQFSLFTVITLLVGATIGVERVALPPLAKHTFGVVSVLYTVSFVAAFGAVKAVMNLVAGRLSDRLGRKRILLVGWAFALPYALLIIFAQAWWWVVLANLFLGVNQGLTWSMSVTAKIDLVGPAGRGLAVGLDESAGYVGTGIGGLAAGLLVASYGLRPAPYLLALGVVAAGALITFGPARETLPWARAEAARHHAAHTDQTAMPGVRQLARYMSWHDRSMLAVCQAGMINKVADSLVIGFFPLYFLRRGLSVATVGVLVGVYAWVWGLGQVPTGWLADHVGRKWPITAGTFLIGAGIAIIASTTTVAVWYLGATVMGGGMALAYPNLITAVGDSAHPAWRGGALGVYRLWRDSGYALGPLVLGGIAALSGISAALWVGAALLGASTLVLLALLRETEPGRRAAAPPWQSRPEWITGQPVSEPAGQATL